MNRLVSPVPASSGHPFCAAVSSTRTAVLPTATIRPPAACISFTSLAVAAGSSYHSGSITCRWMSSQVTGLKVPGPTCSVTYAVLMPCALRARSSGPLKCRPAAGAGARPLVLLVALAYQRVLHLASHRPLAARQARWNHLRVIQAEQVVRAEQRGKLAEAVVGQRAGAPIHDEEPGTVAGLDRMLGDQRLIEGIVEVLQPHQRRGRLSRSRMSVPG